MFKGGVNMFKVTKDWNVSIGTSEMGNIQLVYSDIVRAFGEPMKSDEYKISGKWVFHDKEAGVVFTLYDWKSTNLYDPDYPSVEEFRADPEPQTFNIGGNRAMDVEEFKSLLKKQIEWVKRKEDKAEVELVGFASPHIKTENECSHSKPTEGHR